MDRILKNGMFALLVFALGTIAGHFILTGGPVVQPAHETTGESASIRPVGKYFAEIPSSKQNDERRPSPGAESFQLTAFGQSVGTSDVSSQSASGDAGTTVNRDTVTQAILNRFPDLSEDTLAGWVDTYQHVPLNELETLLDDRLAMSSLLPAGSSLLAESDFSDTQCGSPLSDHNASAINDALGHIQYNVLHSHTPGYRRLIVHTCPVSVRSDQRSDSFQVATSFDFTPGRIQPSTGRFHMAIDGRRQLWFRLGDGDLLTRYGRFTRLKDGRLGILDDDQELPLFGEITVPDSAFEFQITESGELTYVDDDGTRTSAGLLKLAQINDLSQLESQNGIFFRITGDASITMTTADAVKTRCLELSNVVTTAEAELRHSFEVLRQFTNQPALP